MTTTITDVRTSRQTIPLRQPFVTALRTVTSVPAVRVEVVAGDTSGSGEAAPTPVITGDLAAGIEAALAGPLRDAVVGRDLDDFEDVLRSVGTAVVGNTSAKAALDIALHDTRARALGLSLPGLLGAASGSVGTDVTVSAGPPKEMAAEADRRAAEGFGTLKLKVADGRYDDTERVLRVRDAVGPDVAVRMDANQGWSAKEAVAVIGACERAEARVELVEQPVAAADLAGLAFVTDHVRTTVMADESVASARDAVRVVELRAADLINVKLMKCGGLRPARQILDIAAAAGVGAIVGGMMEGELAVAAAAALAATCPADVVHDLDAAWWLDRPATGRIVRYDGDRLLLPAGPGLGAPPSDRS